MLKPRWLTFGLIFLAIAAGDVCAQQVGRSASLPTRRLLDRYNLERAWWNQARLNPGREKVRYLTVDEEIAYVQSTGGILTAFDNETGKHLWAIQLGRRDYPSFPVVSNQEVVMVITGIRLYALNKFSGEPLWDIRMPGQPSTRPAADDLHIYVGMLDGSVYAFDLRKIKQLFAEQRLPAWSHQTIVWRYKTGKKITTPPITSTELIQTSTSESVRDVVNFASLDKSLYAVTARGRELLFQFETQAPVSAPLSYADGYVFLASEDSHLYCINAQNGAVRWEVPFGLPLEKAARVVGNDLYVFPLRGGIHALSRISGVERWWRPRVTRFLAATRDSLFVSDHVGNVVLLSRETGGVIGALPLRQFSIRLENDRTDRLYMATPSGLVVCIREKGSEFPLFHMYPERRPILPVFVKPEDGQANPMPPEGAGNN